MSYRTAAVVLLFSLVVVACEDPQHPTEARDASPSTEVSQLAAQSAPAAAASLARALAQAMADPDVRQQVLQDMRSSRWTEHKLMLQDYLERPSGRGLLGAASRASGLGVDQLQQIADSYPPLDFYVPVPEQRRSWTGSGQILVAAVLNPDATKALAFAPDGGGQTVTTPEVPGIDAFFVIHGAESKTLHEDRNLGAGSTIEDEAEEASDPMVSAQSCSEISVEDCGDSGSGADPGTDVIMLEIHFKDGDFNGAAEVYWETGPSSGSGAIQRSDKVEGLEPCQVVLAGVELYDLEASPTQPLTAFLYEDDSLIFGGSDDEEGQATITGDGAYVSTNLFPESPSECTSSHDVRAEFTVDAHG